jgi:Predicted acetyltransferase
MKVDLIGNIKLSYLDSDFEYKILNAQKMSHFSFPTSKPQNLSEFNENRFGYILTENNEYIGHTVVSKRFNNTLYIEDFDIDFKYRGKGYAQNLMNFLTEEAKKSNLGGISLEVQNNNVTAFLFI